MTTPRSDLCSQYIKIFTVVSCYWIVSILTVFVNKTLLSSKDTLKAPLFISWFQCFVSFLICFALSSSGGIPKVFTFPKGTPWNRESFKSTFPLSILFSLMIASNNLSLKEIDVSFYYVARSLTTVFNVFFAWILLRERTSFRCMSCCAFIIYGFYLGVDQESLFGSFSTIGTIYGVISSLVLSLYSIFTKKVLPSVNQEVWLLSFYNNAYASLLFIPFIILTGELSAVWNYSNIGSMVFWLKMIIGGLCGISIGYFTSLQIKVTSPLTHNISGTAKSCAQTVIANRWFENKDKNWLWWTSNIIVLVASAFYARFKQQEMEANARKPVPEEKRSLV